MDATAFRDRHVPTGLAMTKSMEEKDVNLKIIPPAKYLPWVAAGVAAMLMIFLAAATYTQVLEGRYAGQSTQYKNTISVSGEGKVVAKPDIGQISLSVISNASTVAVAQKDNTNKMNKIVAAMKDAGIAEVDMKTASYSLYPQYQYTSGKSTIIGYEVSQTLEVKIRDLDKVGDILGKATAAGANQMGSLSLTFDDPEELNAQARQKAIDNAKEKAQKLAAALGVSLGKITSFSENNSGDSATMYSYNEKAVGMGGASSVPDIQTGQNEIQVNVNIAYEIY